MCLLIPSGVGCDGNLVPVAVKSTRLGGGLSVFFLGVTGVK